jgi:hypothetical protein
MRSLLAAPLTYLIQTTFVWSNVNRCHVTPLAFRQVSGCFKGWLPALH